MHTRSFSVRPRAFADEEAVVEDVVVRQRRALGESGRAGGVLDVNGVVELQRRFTPFRGPPRRPTRPRRQERRPVLVEAEDAAQGGAARPGGVEHGAVDQLAETAGVEEDADAGLAQGVLQLGGLVGGVDVDEDGADAGGGVLDDDPLLAVGRPDADAVARRHAEGEEAAGGLRDRIPQLAVGGAIVLPSRPRSRRGGRGVRPRRGGCRRWSGRAAACGRCRGNTQERERGRRP